MENTLSDYAPSVLVIVIVAVVFIILGIAVPALTPRRGQPPEKRAPFMQRVFSRRRK